MRIGELTGVAGAAAATVTTDGVAVLGAAVTGGGVVGVCGAGTLGCGFGRGLVTAMVTGVPPCTGVMTGVRTTATNAPCLPTPGCCGWRTTDAGITRCWIAGTASGAGGADSRTVSARSQN